MGGGEHTVNVGDRGGFACRRIVRERERERVGCRSWSSKEVAERSVLIDLKISKKRRRETSVLPRNTGYHHSSQVACAYTHITRHKHWFVYIVTWCARDHGASHAAINSVSFTEQKNNNNKMETHTTGG